MPTSTDSVYRKLVSLAERRAGKFVIDGRYKNLRQVFNPVIPLIVTGRKIKIIFENIPTAFYRPEDDIIGISQRACTWAMFEDQFGFMKDDVDWAQKNINDILKIVALYSKRALIHESQHALYRNETLRLFRSFDRHEHTELLGRISNSVEDLYIDNHVESQHFQEDVDCGAYCLFNEIYLEQLPKADEVGTLTFLKCPPFVNIPSDVLEKVEEVYGNLTRRILALKDRSDEISFSDRVQLTWDIYEMFKDQKTEEEMDEMNGDSGGSGLEGSIEGEELDAETAKAIAQAMQQAIEQSGGTFNGVTLSSAGMSDNPDDLEEFGRMLKLHFDHEGQVPAQVLVQYQKPLRDGRYNIHLLQSWKSAIRPMAAIDKPEEQYVDGVSGSDFAEPYNIQSQLLMETSNPNIWRAKINEGSKRPKVTIICDSSGSIGSAHEELMQHGYSMYISLSKLGFETRVVCHTTNGLGAEVYIVVDFDDVLRGDSARRAFAATSNIGMSANADGFVILCEGDLLEAGDIMVVISDGQPYWSGYSGQRALQHTTACVNLQRRKGIAVMSVSIERSCIESNNGIYGEEWNIDAATDLSTGLRSAARRIVVQAQSNKT